MGQVHGSLLCNMVKEGLNSGCCLVIVMLVVTWRQSLPMQLLKQVQLVIVELVAIETVTLHLVVTTSINDFVSKRSLRPVVLVIPEVVTCLIEVLKVVFLPGGGFIEIAGLVVEAVKGHDAVGEISLLLPSLLLLHLAGLLLVGAHFGFLLFFALLSWKSHCLGQAWIVCLLSEEIVSTRGWALFVSSIDRDRNVEAVGE